MDGPKAPDMKELPLHASTQVLPRERAAVFINGVKQIGDLVEVARFELGLIEARRFYIKELGWCEDAFKSKMYQIWIAKQVSSFCGTKLMPSRMLPPPI
jgi:hypothetical protein